MSAAVSTYTVPTTVQPNHTLTVPGSKSLTNRALILAALADGRTRLEGALVAEDSDVMKSGLAKLGFKITDGGTEVEVEGLGGRIPSHGAQLDLRLSGTSIRFLAALVALGSGSFALDGNERMRERPIQDLLASLRELGVDARSVHNDGCPPVIVDAAGLKGGHVRVAGDRSSQFLSALLMVAPYAAVETVIEVTGELQSKPFVDMTVGLMDEFGIAVERDGYRSFIVPQGRYGPRRYQVEGDAMAAGYFWAAAAATGGRVRVDGLGEGSVQGDARLVRVLEQIGCQVTWADGYSEVRAPASSRLAGGRFDFNDMPDQAQTLAVLALFASEPIEIVNIPNLRIKETDRLAALANELVKFGAQVEEREDSIRIVPPARPTPARVESYGDHRMAMAFAVAGLAVPGTEILGPECVAKTYPGFFHDLEALAASGRGL